MKVQTRLIILILLAVIITIISFSMLIGVEKTRLSQLFKDRKNEEMEIFDNILRLKGKSLETLAYDYTYWDEMVDFLATGNKAWAEKTIDTGVLTNYQADAIWIYKKDLSLAYSINSLKDEKLKDIPFSKDLINNLFLKEHFCHFFIDTPFGLMEISGATIHPTADTERKTPAQGYFFTARRWDNDYLEQIEKLTRSTIAISPGLKEERIFDDNPSVGMITFPRLLSGWDKNPLIRLDVKIKAESIKYFYKSFQQELYFLLIFAIVGLLSVSFTIIRWVGRPLRLISRSLNTEDAMHINNLQKSSSEFGVISRLIDKFFKQKTELANEITERKRAEEVLQQVAEEWKRTFDAVSDLICIIDTTHTIRRVNQAMAKALGVSPEEAIGLKCYHCVHKTDAPPELCPHKKLLQDGKTHGLEAQVDTLGGYFEISVSPIYDAKSNLSGSVHIAHDITERKKVIEEIQQQRDRLVLLNSLLALSLESIPINTLLEKALELILRLSWVTIESRGIIYLIEDDLDVLVMKAQKGLTEAMLKTCARVPLGKCLCGQAAFTKEIQFVNSIDERHEIRYESIQPHGHYCVPILYAGRVLGVFTVYLQEGHVYNSKEEDFLKAIANTLAGEIGRRNTEEQLKKSKEFVEVIFHSMHDAISIIDVRDFKIIDANKVFLDSMGKKREEVIGKTCYEITHRRHQPCIPPDDVCPIADILKTDTTSTVEHVHYTKEDKKIYVEITASPIKNEKGETIHILHAARNITERKKAEEELRIAYDKLRQMQAQLIQASKMSGLGSLSSGIAHEINNPLTGVLNNVQLIKMSIAQDKNLNMEDFKELLDSMEESAQRCANITRALLDFGRPSKGVFQLISIKEIIGRVLILVRHNLEMGNIKIQRDIESNLPEIKCDPQLLQQAIFDIVSNAQWAIQKKSKEEGGIITIKASYDPNKDTAGIYISDTGIGIPEEDLKRIFEPFFTTRGVGEGSGLGLFMVYNIIKEHKGNIEVESQPNQGTTFKISLPVG